ncbi:hypothetical protein DYH09_35090 [bacterium CPR1]|nr:hypothetical protein [bacterium CPR1]
MGSKLPNEAKSTFTLRLPEEVAERTHFAARKAGIPRNDLILLALTEYLARQDKPAPKPERKASARTRFLQAVREHYGQETALERSGVKRAELSRWMQEPEFAAEVAAAQSYYLEALEAVLAAIGRGERKGTTGALTAILAAHHASYGRVRAELVLKILSQEHGALVLEIAKELGDQSREALERALARYETGRDIRLAGFTE